MSASAFRRGFTLIELLVIILIIAVVGSIVVPAYATFWARARFDTILRETRDLFRYAREQAVQGDTMATVAFDPRNQTLLVTVLPAPPLADQPVALMNGDPQNPNLPPPPSAPRGLEIGGEFAVAGFQVNPGASSTLTMSRDNATELHFRGDGTCEGAQIILMSSYGYKATLVVWPGTGRVTIEEDA